MDTPKGSTPNPSGMEIRRRLTTPALAQQQPQSMPRPQNVCTYIMQFHDFFKKIHEIDFIHGKIFRAINFTKIFKNS